MLAVISLLLLVSYSGNHLSLYVHYVVMFLFLLSPGEFDVETLSVGRGVIIIIIIIIIIITVTIIIIITIDISSFSFVECHLDGPLGFCRGGARFRIWPTSWPNIALGCCIWLVADIFTILSCLCYNLNGQKLSSNTLSIQLPNTLRNITLFV